MMEGEASDVLKPETAAEQLYFVTARLQCTKSGKTWGGTGFFVHVPVASGEPQVVLITNRHVLSHPDYGSAETVLIITPAAQPDDRDLPLFGRAATVIAHRPAFEPHPNSDVDVAVMAFSGLPLVGGFQPFIKTLPMDMLINEAALAQLDAIEPVTFIGYPNALHDTVNMTPIARRGWTATPISLDHNGKPTFLIDASVFPGSSGSPVFILDSGSYGNRQGAIVMARRILLLGIVAAVHVHATTGELIPTLNLPKVSVNQVMNLGIVYKTRTLVEAIDRFLATKGLSRVQTSPIEPASTPVDPPSTAVPA
jgi:hypothetical protein